MGRDRDPKPGITRCIQYALSELGYRQPDADELHWCIGPSLKDSISGALGDAAKMDLSSDCAKLLFNG